MEQVWLLRRVVTVCWLAAGSVLLAERSGLLAAQIYKREGEKARPRLEHRPPYSMMAVVYQHDGRCA